MRETLGSIPRLGRSPGEGNATHCSILAWEIPWTEEPGGLQFMGSRRVGPDRAAEHAVSQGVGSTLVSGRDHQ